MFVVPSDELLRDFVSLAKVLYRLLLSDGGGIEFPDAISLVIQMLDPPASVHCLHPQHLYRPLVESRQLGGRVLRSSVFCIDLVLEDQDHGLIFLVALGSSAGLLHQPSPSNRVII